MNSIGMETFNKNQPIAYPYQNDSFKCVAFCGVFFQGNHNL